jgi:cation transport ATPase
LLLRNLFLPKTLAQVPATQKPFSTKDPCPGSNKTVASEVSGFGRVALNSSSESPKGDEDPQKKSKEKDKKDKEKNKDDKKKDKNRKVKDDDKEKKRRKRTIPLMMSSVELMKAMMETIQMKLMMTLQNRKVHARSQQQGNPDKRRLPKTQARLRRKARQKARARRRMMALRMTVLLTML